MSIDVYGFCPCGSGKKLKFCCYAVAAEMEKVAKLQEGHQSRMALQLLDQIDKSHPGNPWAVTTRATILLGEERYEESAQCLGPLLESNPRHCLATGLYGTARFANEGFESAKSDIHRAFQRCIAVYPDMMGGLAAGIGSAMFATGNFMASREHLVLSMRLVPEKDREPLFLRLLEVDGERSIPYPLRSVHPLVHVAPTDETQKELRRAMQLSSIGCWNAAAAGFETLVEQEPENAGLRQNSGLCRAWDGDHASAVITLHEAAQRHEAFDTAVECETVAQLLELATTVEQVRVATAVFDVKSVSRLVTILDDADRIARIEIPAEGENAERQNMPAAFFQLLDRAVPNAEEECSALTLETVPQVLAQVSIYDANTDRDEPARAYLMGYEGEPFDSARALFEAASGEEIEVFESEEPSAPMMDSLPRDFYPLHWRWYFPQATPFHLRSELEQQQWQKLVNDVWPNAPLSGLGGKTPFEAVGVDELKISLAAAVYAFDAYCDRNRYHLDKQSLCDRLKIEIPGEIDVTEKTELNSFTAMQLQRLPLGKLNDQQLLYTLNRAMLIHHGTFVYGVLTELLNRPNCQGSVDLNRVYLTLTDLCRERYQQEEMLEWIKKGKEAAQSHEDAFERVLTWEMRELTHHLQNPDDSALKPLVTRLMQYYGPKIPRFEGVLRELLAAHGADVAGLLSETIVTSDSEPASGGLWTPGSTDQGSGEKKLWVPGQS